MGLWRAKIGSENLGMESSGSRDFDGSDHGDMGLSVGCIHRRLTELRACDVVSSLSKGLLKNQK
jgi:hypothetical protein